MVLNTWRNSSWLFVCRYGRSSSSSCSCVRCARSRSRRPTSSRSGRRSFSNRFITRPRRDPQAAHRCSTRWCIWRSTTRSSAIEGGYSPYRASKSKPRERDADVKAAVATAAYLTARARVAPTQVAYLDQEYANFMAGLPEGRAKADGIRIGTGSATTLLEARAGDGFSNVVLYQCSEVPPPPGEFDARHRLPRRRHRIRSRLMRRSGRSSPTRSPSAPTSSRAGRAR